MREIMATSQIMRKQIISNRFYDLQNYILRDLRFYKNALGELLCKHLLLQKQTKE